MVFGNSCHTLIFKDRQSENSRIPRKEWTIKLPSRIFETYKILEILRFIFNIFFIFPLSLKIPQDFQIFKTTGIYLPESSLTNVCSKFQVIQANAGGDLWL